MIQRCQCSHDFHIRWQVRIVAATRSAPCLESSLEYLFSIYADEHTCHFKLKISKSTKLMEAIRKRSMISIERHWERYRELLWHQKIFIKEKIQSYFFLIWKLRRLENQFEMNNFAIQMIRISSVQIEHVESPWQKEHLSVKMTMSSALPTVFDATKNVMEVGGHADVPWTQEFDLDPDSPSAQVSQNTRAITKAMQQTWHDPSEAVYFPVSCDIFPCVAGAGRSWGYVGAKRRA